VAAQQPGHRGRSHRLRPVPSQAPKGSRYHIPSTAMIYAVGAPGPGGTKVPSPPTLAGTPPP